MSTGSVRAQVAEFFRTVPTLNAVYLDQSTLIQGETFDLGAQNGSAAVAFVHLPDENETRIALPAVTGMKDVAYRVGLVILYQYLVPSAAVEPATQPDSWVIPLDDVIDAVKNKLRADPTCGGGGGGLPVTPGGTVLQAGSDREDIKIARDLPRWTPGKVISWNVVEFTLHEIVQA